MASRVDPLAGPDLPPDWGRDWMSANARDLCQVAVRMAGFDARELAIALGSVRTRGERINARTVERVLGDLYDRHHGRRAYAPLAPVPADPATNP